jgi:hypothetical protein
MHILHKLINYIEIMASLQNKVFPNFDPKKEQNFIKNMSYFFNRNFNELINEKITLFKRPTISLIIS